MWQNIILSFHHINSVLESANCVFFSKAKAKAKARMSVKARFVGGEEFLFFLYSFSVFMILDFGFIQGGNSLAPTKGAEYDNFWRLRYPRFISWNMDGECETRHFFEYERKICLILSCPNRFYSFFRTFWVLTPAELGGYFKRHLFEPAILLSPSFCSEREKNPICMPRRRISSLHIPH